MFPKEFSHPVFYGDLVYKLRRVKCEANFVSLGSKIVKPAILQKMTQLQNYAVADLQRAITHIALIVCA